MAMGKLVGRAGLDLGERLRLVVVAETVGWMGVGLRPPAGSAETRREVGREVDDANPGPPDQESTPCYSHVYKNQYFALCLNLALARS